MVQRSFIAFDSAAMLIDPSSPSGAPGSSIINNSSTPNGTIFEFQPGFGNTRITLDDTSVDPNDTLTFEDDDLGNHTIVDGAGIVANGAQVESESLILVRELDSGGNQIGPTITLTVFSRDGNTSDVWGFSTSEPLSPNTRYEKTGGSNIGDSTYASFICFEARMRVATPDGACEVALLRPGDRVLTRDGRAAPVLWTGRRRVLAEGARAGVVVEKGAFGGRRDVVLSHRHRVLVTGGAPLLLFGEPEVLVEAGHLIGAPGVRPAPDGKADYAHILLDRHEIIDCEGVAAESLLPGPQAAEMVADPGFDEFARMVSKTPAAPILSAWEGRVLARALADSPAPLGGALTPPAYANISPTP